MKTRRLRERKIQGMPRIAFCIVHKEELDNFYFFTKC